MKPTRAIDLAAFTIVVGVLSFGLSRLLGQFSGLPGVPSAAPVMVLGIAVLVFAIAVGFRNRIRAERSGVHPVDERLPKPLDPLQAARAAVLAKAGTIVGSLVAGAYAGYGAYLALDLSVTARRDRAITCGYSVLAGVLLVLASLYLERVLRVPPDQGERRRGDMANDSSSRRGRR